jgi:hypothetical protein
MSNLKSYVCYVLVSCKLVVLYFLALYLTSNLPSLHLMYHVLMNCTHTLHHALHFVSLFMYHAMSYIFLMLHNLELLPHKCETECQLLVRSVNQVTNI